MISMSKKNNICEYCRSSRFVEVKQGGVEAAVKATHKLSLKSEYLYHQLCLDCGTVHRSYVYNPKRLA